MISRDPWYYSDFQLDLHKNSVSQDQSLVNIRDINVLWKEDPLHNYQFLIMWVFYFSSVYS